MCPQLATGLREVPASPGSPQPPPKSCVLRLRRDRVPLCLGTPSPAGCGHFWQGLQDPLERSQLPRPGAFGWRWPSHQRARCTRRATGDHGAGGNASAWRAGPAVATLTQRTQSSKGQTGLWSAWNCAQQREKGCEGVWGERRVAACLPPSAPAPSSHRFFAGVSGHLLFTGVEN